MCTNAERAHARDSLLGRQLNPQMGDRQAQTRTARACIGDGSVAEYPDYAHAESSRELIVLAREKVTFCEKAIRKLSGHLP